MVSGLDGQILAGRVLMQLGSPEKAVTDTVKEVIRILKKTQATAVPQVKLDIPSTDCPTAQLPIALILMITCQIKRSQCKWNEHSSLSRRASISPCL